MGKGKMVLMKCAIHDPHSGDQVCQVLCRLEEILSRHPNASYSLLIDKVGIFQKGIIILPTSLLPAGFLARALLGFSSYYEFLWVCGSLLGSFLRAVLVKPSLQRVLRG